MNRTPESILNSALALTPEEKSEQATSVGRGMLGPAWQQMEALLHTLIPDDGGEYFKRAKEDFYRGNMSGMVLNAMTGMTVQAGTVADFMPATGVFGAMINYHGSPHKWLPEPGFPKGRPRLDKIGTGEGAQAYGWGFYSADAPGVAKSYQDRLVGVPYVHSSGQTRLQYKSDIFEDVWSKLPENARTDEMRTKVANLTDNYTRQFYTRADGGGLTADPVMMNAWLDDKIAFEGRLAANPAYTTGDEGVLVLRAMKDRPLPEWEVPEGAFYKLDIPDEDVAKYLDWDAPLSEQPENIKKAIGALPDYARPLDSMEAQNVTGQRLYQRLSNQLGDQGASEALREAGIPGLKFYDQMSRGSKEGTRNYVTWDQDVLDRSTILSGE